MLSALRRLQFLTLRLDGDFGDDTPRLSIQPQLDFKARLEVERVLRRCVLLVGTTLTAAPAQESPSRNLYPPSLIPATNVVDTSEIDKSP